MVGWWSRALVGVGLMTLGFLGLSRLAEPAPPAAAPAPTAAAVPMVDPALLRLQPVRGPILFAHGMERLDARVAPVVHVLADGAVVLRRPAPLARTPNGSAEVELGAAVLLPRSSLAGLDPRARAALAEVLGQLSAERPVPSGRFRAVDLNLPLADLERLLGWVP